MASSLPSNKDKQSFWLRINVTEYKVVFLEFLSKIRLHFAQDKMAENDILTNEPEVPSLYILVI